MVITLKQQLVMNSYKTIDERGASVHKTGGGCITVHNVNNIIIHDIHIHECKPVGNAMITDSPNHVRIWERRMGIVSPYVHRNTSGWTCSLANCYDALIDATLVSTAITISNNYMTHHNKVMLLGHNVDMDVFHVVNNDYTHWEMYAVGGSAAPTIYCEGNRFLAPDDPSKKEVGPLFKNILRSQQNIYIIFIIFNKESEWRKWKWKTDGDLMLNGAYFRQSGSAGVSTYDRASSLSAQPSQLVDSITMGAGVLTCKKGSHC
ncbi:hypothetical protein Cgig2_009143 [Carnegiea gigantea]|uniref:Pectate lyase n=1 Tax=Carnegiea gigantea TaxID=171969 RepID=A0A9Q1JPI2_9CARY|nr:hypothetical protein Cgig2_009143 [Carnegiea gigantea]